MQHIERLQHVRNGTDYKAPLRAINESIEGIVHCGLIVRASEDGILLTPEARALDAIGVQVERELRNRAEMIRALVDRCNVLEARLRGEPDPERELTPRERIEHALTPRDDAIMPEQRRETLHMTIPE
jgi:hypothetical protein